MTLPQVRVRIDTTRDRIRKLFADAYSTPTNSSLLSRALRELQAALETLQFTENAAGQHIRMLGEEYAQIAAERHEYFTLFNEAPEAYLVTSLDSVIRRANRAAARLLGIEQRKLARFSIGGAIVPGERRIFRALLREATSLPRVDNWSLRLSTPTGEQTQVVATVERVCNSQGKPTALRWQLYEIKTPHMYLASNSILLDVDNEMAEAIKVDIAKPAYNRQRE